MRKILIVVIGLFFVSGCVGRYGNQNIANTDLIKKIQIGKTTKPEVDKMFGKSELQVRKGKNMYIYTYKITSIYLSRPDKNEYWQLQCFFDKNGILENFNYYNEVH